MNFRDDTVDSNPEPCGESLFLTRDGTSPRSIDAALPASTQQLPRVRCQEQASRSERSEPEEIFAARGPNLEFAASAATEENFASAASEENFADLAEKPQESATFRTGWGERWRRAVDGDGRAAEGRGWGWETLPGEWMWMGDGPRGTLAHRWKTTACAALRGVEVAARGVRVSAARCEVRVWAGDDHQQEPPRRSDGELQGLRPRR